MMEILEPSYRSFKHSVILTGVGNTQSKELKETTIQKTVNFLKISKSSRYLTNAIDRNAAIDQAVVDYHNPDVTDKQKDDCRCIIIHNMYFLLLRVMERYKFPQFLFDDAIQNAVCEILVALDKVDLDKKTKFSSYIQHYLKAAACDTAVSIASVKTPYCARKKTMALINNYYSHKGDTMSVNALENAGVKAVSTSTQVEPKEINLSDDIHDNTSVLSDNLGSTDTQLIEENLTPIVSSKPSFLGYHAEGVTQLGERQHYLDKLDGISKIDFEVPGIAPIDKCTDDIDIEELSITKEYIEILTNILQVLPSVDSDTTRRRYRLGKAIISSDEDTYLTDKEKVVIIHRFGIFGAPQMTLKEVATLFNVRGWKATSPRILQIQQAAILKLRGYMDFNNITF